MIETIRWQYDPKELLRWEAFDRHGHGFPQSRHLKYCKFDSGDISCERQQYFAEAWVCRRCHEEGCEVFHERYWLHDLDHVGRQTYSNPRLKEILGEDACKAIAREARTLSQFGNPDVIAYDPSQEKVYMFEVKLEKPSGYRDRIKPHQVKSLELLQRLLPTAEIAIVELSPLCEGHHEPQQSVSRGATFMMTVPGVIVFSTADDPEADPKFKDWKRDYADHQDALYLNVQSAAKAKIHRAACRHAHNDNPETDGDNTKNPKVCCLTGHGRLREYAKINHLAVTRCNSCRTHW